MCTQSKRLDVCLYIKAFLSYIYVNPTPALALHRSVNLIICTARNRRHLCSEYSNFLVPIQTDVCALLVAFSASLGMCTTCTDPFQSVTYIWLCPSNPTPASVIPFSVILGISTTCIVSHHLVSQCRVFAFQTIHARFVPFRVKLGIFTTFIHL